MTFLLTGTVALSATGSLVNTATVNAPIGVTDPNPGNNSATDTDTQGSSVTLLLTKTDGSATYTPGATAIYTITVANAGPSNAGSITLTDSLPSGVVLTGSATCTPTGTASCGTISGAAGGTVVTATGATIAAGCGQRPDDSIAGEVSAGLDARSPREHGHRQRSRKRLHRIGVRRRYTQRRRRGRHPGRPKLGIGPSGARAAMRCKPSAFAREPKKPRLAQGAYQRAMRPTM